MENYKLGEIIGIGGNSKIYKVTDKKGENYAMKIIKKDKNGRYKNEIFYHSNLENKNIIRLYDSFENQNKIFILLELCGDNLYNYKKERKLKEKEIISIFSQIVNAIYYLHRNNIVHRDIKPENILESLENLKDNDSLENLNSLENLKNNDSLKDNDSLENLNSLENLKDNKSLDIEEERGKIWKLSDFGFVDEEGEFKESLGTPDYLAPEIVSYQKYKGAPIDIWTLGILLYELLYDEPPFYRTDYRKTYNAILTEEVKFQNESVLNSIIKSMLTKNPSKRIKIEEVLEFLDSI